MQEAPSTSINSTVIDDDGIFTVTIGSTQKTTINKKENTYKDMFIPCPRINCGLVVKHNVLYLYGGMFEDGNRQYTLNDFYSLGVFIIYVYKYICAIQFYKMTINIIFIFIDCRKLDEWRTILRDDLSSQTWYDSSDSSTDNEDTDDSNENDLINMQLLSLIHI